MRVLYAAGLILAVATSAASGQIRSGGDAGPAAGSRGPATLRYLSQRIPEVDFEEVGLDQLMDWIASLTPMNVVVRWRVLEEVGIERDKPITMRVRNLRLSQVLWMIMNEAGGPDLKLAYRASGELLILSTEEDLRKEMVLCVYDISDLLIQTPRFRAPVIDFDATSEGGGFGSLGRGGQPDVENAQPDWQQDADVQKLIDLIVATVEPDSWAANGGLGTIRAFHDMLVVRNSIRVHQALGGYVAEDE